MAARPRPAGVRVTLAALLSIAVAMLPAAGCLGMQDVRDHCLSAPDNCPPCQADKECVIVSNACHATAACTHRDAQLSVNQIGCSRTYDVPPDDVCRCSAGICRSSE